MLAQGLGIEGIAFMGCKEFWQVRPVCGKVSEPLSQGPGSPSQSQSLPRAHPVTLGQSQNSDAHFREVKNADLAGLGRISQCTVWDSWEEVCVWGG